MDGDRPAWLGTWRLQAGLGGGPRIQGAVVLFGCVGKNAKRRREQREVQAKARRLRSEYEDDFNAAMDAQLEAFRVKFGRDPGPGDPLFFDPDSDEPRALSVIEIENEMTSTAREAGIDPALIYAMQTTGMMVTEANLDLLSDEDVDEWNEAVDRYRRLHP